MRIVQESLTNVLRHADGANASVTLDFAGEHVIVEVADAGCDSNHAVQVGGAGRGLIGIRERVDALGGTVTARPFAGRGFVVRAVLPVERPPQLHALAVAASASESP